jgi:hypothetical protein
LRCKLTVHHGFSLARILFMPQPPNDSRFSAAMQKVQPTLKSAWVSARPPLVQVLKGTVNTLQSAIAGLEQQIQVADRTPNTVQPLDLTPVKTLATGFWTKSQPIWVKVLAFVRSKLSPDTSGKLSDRALSGVLAGVLLLVLSVTTHLPNGRTTTSPRRSPIASPTAITAQRPTLTPAKPISPIPANPAPAKIAQQFPVDVGQASTPFPADLSSPIAAAPIGPKVPAIATAPVIPAPIIPAPVIPAPVIPAPVIPAPKPVVKLTPNQKLLAKLQATTAPYGQPDDDNLAQAVRPNKTTKTLEVTLTPGWSKLSSTQQDKLASDLFSQAQTLRFKTLELTDAQNTLLARSPIVGSDMVILTR